MGAGQRGGGHDHRRLRLRARPRPQPPGDRHARPPRRRPRLQHDRHRPRRTPRCTAACSTRRNLLLVDQRGTGRSEPIDCPELQNLHGAVRRRGRPCGAASATAPTTTRRPVRRRPGGGDRASSASGKVDLYGDSYGTFFAQVFAGRHPDLLRSVVLDARYPTYGESAGTRPRGRRCAAPSTLVCERSAPCRTGGGDLRAAARAGAATRCATTRGEAGRTTPTAGRCAGGGGRQDARDVAFGATYAPGVLPRADRRPAVRPCGRPQAAVAAGRRGHRRRHRRRACRATTARGWTRRWPATTTRSCTT